MDFIKKAAGGLSGGGNNAGQAGTGGAQAGGAQAGGAQAGGAQGSDYGDKGPSSLSPFPPSFHRITSHHLEPIVIGKRNT